MNEPVYIPPTYSARFYKLPADIVDTRRMLTSNPSRLGFYVTWVTAANPAIISWNPQPLQQGGICLQLNTQPHYFSRRQMGEVITGEWYIYLAVSADNIHICEIVKDSG